MSKDYYKILGVDKGASNDEIKKAFRKRAHEYHPDKKHGDEAKFKEANEAYQVLSDSKKKSQYDQFGSDPSNAGGGQGFGGTQGFDMNMDDLGDIFGDMFGFGGGRGRGRARSRRGADIQAILNIDFLESIFGVEKEISLNKTIKCTQCKGNGAEPGSKIETCKTCAGIGQVTKIQRTILGQMQVQVICPSCQGEGKNYSKKCTKCKGHGIVRDMVKLKVKIPAGINDGEVIRLSGQGEAGEKGVTPGDLYLNIQVKPDRRFARNEDNILSKTEISFTSAALGDKIDIETVDGSVELKIPEGTQTNTTFILRGKGVTHLHGRGKGDHLVEVVVKTPKGLNKKQKEALRELNI